MNVDSVDSASSLEPLKAASLDKMDFLKLLVSQVQNQDPLNPMSNDQFVSQLTQFSILEQNQNLNSNMETLKNLSSAQQAAALVGKTVEYLDADTGEKLSGRVDRVTFSSAGTTYFVGDLALSSDDLIGVAADPVETSTPVETTTPETISQ